MEKKIITVEIEFLDGDIHVYQVSNVFEYTDKDGVTYLAMQRLSDGDYGYIPLEVFSSYRIIEKDGLS